MPSAEPSPPVPTKRKRKMDAEGAAALGVAGWMLAAELLTMMRDKGVISTEVGEAIIARALADAQALADRVQSRALQDSIETLRRLLENWPLEPPRR
jgi:hypothetical protein